MSTELFPAQTLSETEQTIVADALSMPAVKKYLTALANDAIKDIVYGQAEINETPESYLRRLALVKGRLEAVNTLLQIQAA